MIRFTCECGKIIKTVDENRGKAVRCPKCLIRCVVPMAGQASCAIREHSPPPPPAQTRHPEHIYVPDYSDPGESGGSRPHVMVGFAIFLGIMVVCGSVVVAFAIVGKREQQQLDAERKQKNESRTQSQDASRFARASDETRTALSQNAKWIPELEDEPNTVIPPKATPKDKGGKEVSKRKENETDAPETDAKEDPRAKTPEPDTNRKDKAKSAKSTEAEQEKEEAVMEAIEEMVARGRAAISEGDFVAAKKAFTDAEKACIKSNKTALKIIKGEVCFRLAYLYGSLDKSKAAGYLSRGKTTLISAKLELAEINFRYLKIQRDMKALEAGAQKQPTPKGNGAIQLPPGKQC